MIPKEILGFRLPHTYLRDVYDGYRSQVGRRRIGNMIKKTTIAGAFLGGVFGAMEIIEGGKPAVDIPIALALLTIGAVGSAVGAIELSIDMASIRGAEMRGKKIRRAWLFKNEFNEWG